MPIILYRAACPGRLKEDEEAAGGAGANEQPPPEGDVDELELGLDLAKKK